MKNKQSQTGNPPSSFPIYERLLYFIDSVLPNFKVLSTDQKGNFVISEDLITEDLADFFNSEQELLLRDNAFSFINQSQKKTDIGVRLGRRYLANNRKLICWIEAKRLPTPNKNNDRDAREYVFVSQDKNEKGKKIFKGNGGIQRFKECKHASDLSFSIMIGYIQDDNDGDYWLSKINAWISELANANFDLWTNEDCLKKYESNKCNRYFSTHKRREKDPITLQHFWIKLCK